VLKSGRPATFTRHRLGAVWINEALRRIAAVPLVGAAGQWLTSAISRTAAKRGIKSLANGSAKRPCQRADLCHVQCLLHRLSECCHGLPLIADRLNTSARPERSVVFTTFTLHGGHASCSRRCPEQGSGQFVLERRGNVTTDF
jgi:hypothetical protein